MLGKYPQLFDQLAEFKRLLVVVEAPPKTVLLAEGQVSKRAYFVRSGCLRAWFNQEGRDVSFQFYFEGQAVASLESFLTSQPSLFYLETIEPTTLWSLSRGDFDRILAQRPHLKDVLLEVAFQRMSDYQHLFLSWIKTSPEQRYADLLATQPQVAQRVPQQHIASYLGITPVSLSRLRRRAR